MIGAGPAGLTYASLVADGNTVTVYEKGKQAGGAFRYAGKAPLFQEVEANEESFERYIVHLVTACEMHGVKFRYATDVTAHPALLEPFDRIVIATGADYRHRRLGRLALWMLDHGLARAPGMVRLFSSPKLRHWFYYEARVGNRQPLPDAGAAGAACERHRRRRQSRQEQRCNRERLRSGAAAAASRRSRTGPNP